MQEFHRWRKCVMMIFPMPSECSNVSISQLKGLKSHQNNLTTYTCTCRFKVFQEEIPQILTDSLQHTCTLYVPDAYMYSSC